LLDDHFGKKSKNLRALSKSVSLDEIFGRPGPMEGLKSAENKTSARLL
jgi:hypothetical protein